MNDSGFCLQKLSDKLIGKVIPKVEIRRHIPFADETHDKTRKGGFTGEHSYLQVAEKQPRTHPYKTRCRKSRHPVLLPKHHAITSKTVELTTKKMLPADSSTYYKRRSTFISDLQKVNQVLESIEASSLPITDELKRAIIEHTMKKKFRHREYCRLNQERQRKLEKKKETDIQDAIAKLQCEIDKLSKKSKAAATATTIWAVVLECSSYFNSYVSSDILHATALTFLHGIMTPDVVIGSEFGVEAQLQIWKLFTFYFDDIHLEMTEMDMSTPHTLVAGTILSVTITSNTLVRAFPHLTNVGSGGTKGDKWSPLANRLLGQKLVMRGSALFGWNNAINKVERLDFHADMMTPVTKLLGNVSDVAYVFSKAHVTPDCRIMRDGFTNI